VILLSISLYAVRYGAPRCCLVLRRVIPRSIATQRIRCERTLFDEKQSVLYYIFYTPKSALSR